MARPSGFCLSFGLMSVSSSNNTLASFHTHDGPAPQSALSLLTIDRSCALIQKVGPTPEFSRGCKRLQYFCYRLCSAHTVRNRNAISVTGVFNRFVEQSLPFSSSIKISRYMTTLSCIFFLVLLYCHPVCPTSKRRCSGLHIALIEEKETSSLHCRVCLYW